MATTLKLEKTKNDISLTLLDVQKVYQTVYASLNLTHRITRDRQYKSNFLQDYPWNITQGCVQV
jgi:hypothetical protein